MPAAKVAVRRTQADRRQGSIRKLLDAATDALIEVGYAATSVQEICARAGLSHGGLFRHFPSREALMVAVAEDVSRQMLETYRRKFELLRTREEPLELSMRLTREACRSRLNQAWYELAMAARTSTPLRKALAPLAASYYAAIGRLARELLPDLSALLGDSFDVFVDTIIAVFDGESVQRFVLKKPAVEDKRLELLLSLTRLALSGVR
ncbi:MAG: TetR family transcriptional regulator [Myxococcales bacterium]|nr:TetR family transcriptional regulator [Myxococcales bacterium]